VVVTTFAIRDSAGGLLGTDTYPNFWGSVGNDGPSQRGCLQPGETGYVLGLLSGSSPDLAKAAVAELEIESHTRTPVLSPMKLLPISYQLTGSGFTVKVQNFGTTPAIIDKILSFSVYVLLDDAGAPVGWSYFHRGPADVVVPPNGTTDLIEPGLSFSGRATRMRPIVDFH
jgi:hypothetical protein